MPPLTIACLMSTSHLPRIAILLLPELLLSCMLTSDFDMSVLGLPTSADGMSDCCSHRIKMTHRPARAGGEERESMVRSGPTFIASSMWRYRWTSQQAITLVLSFLVSFYLIKEKYTFNIYLGGCILGYKNVFVIHYCSSLGSLRSVHFFPLK